MKPADRLAMIANFPPEVGGSEHHAGQLAHMLHMYGANIVTASEIGHSYALVPLVYRSRRLFKATLENLRNEMAGASFLIIYASALKTENIDKPRWGSRRKEEWRRVRLAQSAAKMSGKCLIIFDVDMRQKSFWLAAILTVILFFLGPTRIRISSLGPDASGIFAKLTGRTTDIPSKETVLDTLYEISETNISEQSLNPLWLRRVIGGLVRSDKDQKLVADLSEIRRICLEIMHASTRFLINPASSQPFETESLALVNTQVEGTCLSRMMVHMRAVLGENPNLPDDARLNDERFLHWYIHSEFAERAKPSWPIPGAILHKILPAAQKSDAIITLNTLLQLAHRINDISFIPSELQNYFAGKIADRVGNLSRMELLLATSMRASLTGRRMIEEPWAAPEIREWYLETVCEIAPCMSRFSTTSTATQTPLAPSVEIAGIINGDSGLAQNAIMSAEAFRAIQLSPNLRNINRLETPVTIASGAMRSDLKRSVILHNVNANRVPQQRVARPINIQNNPIHIGYLLWELNNIPQSHRLADDMLDDIWCPTSFVQDIYAKAYGREIIKIGKGIALPEVGTADFRRFDFTDDNYVFMTCFDINSSVERKNPLSAVQAFMAAFPTDPNVRMLVKTTPKAPNNWGDPNHQMDAILALARKDSRIVIDNQLLGFRDLIAMIKRADCIVSTHRAEGFGYIPAYGLNFAKPVIVTDYSGTQDFCSDATAHTVPCDLIAPRNGEVIATVEGAVWADIDVSATADAMRHVLDNPEDARQRGLAGQRLMQTYYSPKAHAARYLKRLKQLGAVA